jgi:aryl-phospho-beta-D-glucosidase BglC (GH1 family)
MKIKSSFLKVIRIFCSSGNLIVLLVGLFLNSPLLSQLPTAQQIASKMKVGWNLGNTLEAICGETAWGNPKANQKLIDSVKAAGFDALRLPCAWDCHTTNGIIDSAWIARVKEVVDYCINDSLFVIINIHWDGGWLENNVTTSAQEAVNAKQKNYWTQIANYFKDYDEHLLFAGANEPNVDNAVQMSVLLSYHQTFIDAVRGTGGNNSSRTLIIQGPSTDIDKTNNLMNAMPTDSIANRLIVEVHYYTPWQFCGMTKDETWGKMFYYWGKDYHSTTDVTRNATWGEESELDRLLGLMKTKFVDKGIPVIIGEYSAVKRTLTGNSDQELHLASRRHFYNYLVESAVNKGLIPFTWDTGPYEGVFNRSTGAVVDEGLLDSIMQGAEEGITTSIIDKSNLELPNEFRLEQNYPNPFNPNTTIRYRLPIDSNISLLVCDILGKKVLTENLGLMKAGNQQQNINMSKFKSGIYMYQLIASGTNGNQYNSVKKMIVLR